MHKAANVDRQYVKAGTKEITRVKDFFNIFDEESEIDGAA